MKSKLLIICAFLCSPLGAYSSEVGPRPCYNQKSDISKKLTCLKNVVSVEEEPRPQSSYREFHINFEQPIDHENKSLGTFKQKLVLIHRDESEPLVLQTSGYLIFGIAEAAITKTFKTNQIQVEHRYFAGSTPDNLDWQYLNIKQSADDFHAVVESFKEIYTGPWVNTGASKGGMTSVYHHYFYPNDMAGTVADVAPLSFSRADHRYNLFLKNVGGEENSTCRKNLRNFQIHMLKNSDTFVPMVEGQFEHLGGKEIAFEHAVIESVYYFWQYGNPSHPTKGCEAIPATDSTPERLYHFLNLHADLADYSDEKLSDFLPYYYQAATELGGPDNETEHLEIYRKFEFDIAQYTPKGVPIPYSNAKMREIGQWVRDQAQNILFVYGAFDPWSAAEFPEGRLENDVYKMHVEGGNHGSNFLKLNAEDRIRSMEIIGHWLGKAAPFSSDEIEKDDQTTLDDIEFNARAHLKL